MVLGVAIDGANRPDRETLMAALHSVPVEYPRFLPPLYVDKGYQSHELLSQLNRQGFRVFYPGFGGNGQKRWVVERTHSWLNRYRRLLVRWEKKAENYRAMIHLAAALIAFRNAYPE